MFTWADQFNTYTEACEYYGADTPSSLKSEIEWRWQEDCVAEQDEMEARGGVVFFDNGYLFCELPF